MIKKIEVSASHIKLTDDIQKYIDKKVGRLDRYLPKYARDAAHAEVKMKEEQSKKNDKFTFEVVLFVPDAQMTAKESTMNIFAAIDIVEAKLVRQLKKYKEKKASHSADRKGVLRKLRKAADRDFRGSQN